MRVAFAVAAALILGGCSLMPPSQQQEFTVSGAVPAATPAPFRNTDPQIDAVLARQYCADGYQKLGEASLPSDSGTLQQWQIRCTPYHPTLVAGVPLPSLW
jgi:hypothetical protein